MSCFNKKKKKYNKKKQNWLHQGAKILDVQDHSRYAKPSATCALTRHLVTASQDKQTPTPASPHRLDSPDSLLCAVSHEFIRHLFLLIYLRCRTPALRVPAQYAKHSSK